MSFFRSPVVQHQVDQLTDRYTQKGESKIDALYLADKHLDTKLMEGPLVILFHEMKKEIKIRLEEYETFTNI